jgi:hypothetical protein
MRICASKRTFETDHGPMQKVKKSDFGYAQHVILGYNQLVYASEILYFPVMHNPVSSSY